MLSCSDITPRSVLCFQRARWEERKNTLNYLNALRRHSRCAFALARLIKLSDNFIFISRARTLTRRFSLLESRSCNFHFTGHLRLLWTHIVIVIQPARDLESLDYRCNYCYCCRCCCCCVATFNCSLSSQFVLVVSWLTCCAFPSSLTLYCLA